VDKAGLRFCPARFIVYDSVARGRPASRRIPPPPGCLPRANDSGGHGGFEMTSDIQDHSSAEDESTTELLMRSIYLEAFGRLLVKLHDLFDEPSFESDAFRSAVKNDRDAFQALFSGAEVSGLSAWAGERERYINELTALATFVGIFNKLSGQHIFELASKLSDLNKGHHHPLFEPAKVGDRHRDQSSLWRSRARIVLAVEALIETGTKPKKAEDEVANRLGQRLSAYVGKKAVKERPLATLRNWRKAFKYRRVSDLEGQETYNDGLAKIKAAIATGDRAAIQNIVQGVADPLDGVLSRPFSHR
jgi:hypothetical protein